MFDRLNYSRFGENLNRKGFNSVKRQKSQKYLAVKPAEQLTNMECDFDDFNKIEFNSEQEHHLEYHDVFPDSVATEVFENNLERKEDDVVSSLIDVNHEIIKMKAMASFLQNINIQKAKKQSQKYSRNN